MQQDTARTEASMSRLRSIFVDGNTRTLQEAMEDVVFLSSASQSVRAQLLKQLHLQTVKAEVLDKDAVPEIPDLFLALARSLRKSRNAHYQQMIVIQYMLLDSELFGRFMLRHESDSLQHVFMQQLKQMNSCFITGQTPQHLN